MRAQNCAQGFANVVATVYGKRMANVMQIEAGLMGLKSFTNKKCTIFQLMLKDQRHTEDKCDDDGDVSEKMATS